MVGRFRASFTLLENTVLSFDFALGGTGSRLSLLIRLRPGLEGPGSFGRSESAVASSFA